MGTSWKWQLRDRLGQWMEMDSSVQWLARGQTKSGRIVGSPEEGVALVEDAKTGNRIRLPASRLTALSLPPERSVVPLISNRWDRKPGKIVRVPYPNLPGKPVPENLSKVSDEDLTALWWAARNDPKVSRRKWLKIMLEVTKRRLNTDPHMAGFNPAGALASGAPEDTPSETMRRMTIRLIERELAQDLTA